MNSTTAVNYRFPSILSDNFALMFNCLFLAYLQILDGFFTHIGIEKYGVTIEGNLLLRSLMTIWDPYQVILGVKIVALGITAFLFFAACKLIWLPRVIYALNFVYLFCAVLPWAWIVTH